MWPAQGVPRAAIRPEPPIVPQGFALVFAFVFDSIVIKRLEKQLALL